MKERVTVTKKRDEITHFVSTMRRHRGESIVVIHLFSPKHCKDPHLNV